MRVQFQIGIGYEDSIELAQQIIAKVLEEKDRIVLSDPAPVIAVKELASATVNMKVYFWINYSEVSDIKALSIVQASVKESFIAEGISMPDDAREVIFAGPLEIQKTDGKQKELKKMPTRGFANESLVGLPDVTEDIHSELSELRKQAKRLDEEVE